MTSEYTVMVCMSTTALEVIRYHARISGIWGGVWRWVASFREFTGVKRSVTHLSTCERPKIDKIQPQSAPRPLAHILHWACRGVGRRLRSACSCCLQTGRHDGRWRPLLLPGLSSVSPNVLDCSVFRPLAQAKIRRGRAVRAQEFRALRARPPYGDWGLDDCEEAQFVGRLCARHQRRAI